ncbi:hypothetical protein [Bradyrhizobium sp. USDA 3315]
MLTELKHSERPSKTAEDDLGATQAMRRILQSPSYQEADQDARFLPSGVTRGIHLQLDFLETEPCFRSDRSPHTIGVAEKGKYYEMARRFGQIVGWASERTSGGRSMIMTGGVPELWKLLIRARTMLGPSRSH